GRTMPRWGVHTPALHASPSTAPRVKAPPTTTTRASRVFFVVGSVWSPGPAVPRLSFHPTYSSSARQTKPATAIDPYTSAAPTRPRTISAPSRSLPRSPTMPTNAPLNRKLRMGLVGGGQGAFIGRVHATAAVLDNRAALVAGALSSDPAKAKASAPDYDITP